MVSHLGEKRDSVAGSADGLEFTLSEGPVYFAPEEGNAFAAVLAGWSSLANVDAFEGPGQLVAGTIFTNKTGETVTLAEGSGVVQVEPGQSHYMNRKYVVERSQKPVVLESALRVQGWPELRQRALATAVNPLELEFHPAVDGRVSVRVVNRIEEPLDAIFEIAPGNAVPLRFEKGQRETIVQFSGSPRRAPTASIR